MEQKKTALYDVHLLAGANMVNFANWQLPIHYGSQIEEHHSVRTNAGMFDVSHMTIIDIKGAKAKFFMRTLIANDVIKLTKQGEALYSCMLNDSGGVIDDLIVYYGSDTNYRMIVNAKTRDKNMRWIKNKKQPFALSMQVRDDLAMIAVQGPNAISKFKSAMPGTEEMLTDLPLFSATSVGELFIARTGYTGEDGLEIILPNKSAPFTWKMLLEAGVKACGLGARDTLRLEAGLNLYGQEMDEDISPLEAGLAWTVDLADKARDFIGRSAFEKLKKSGVNKKLVGLILLDKGVMRVGQKLKTNQGEGVITSGGFSPTICKSIALARIMKNSSGNCQVVARNKYLNAKIVKPKFVRLGKILV